MTRKHFAELAELMRKAQNAIHPVTYELMCNSLADFCARHNANFNRTKFLEDCGV